jgi:hypothetical protein
MGVLRAELAEERERAQATIAALQQQLRRAAEAQGAQPDDDPTDPDATRPFGVAEQLDADDDATQPLPAQGGSGAVAPRRDDPRDRSRDDRDERVRSRAGIFDPLPADAREHPRHGPSLSRWVAVAALLLFALVLLGLLFGFLG